MRRRGIALVLTAGLAVGIVLAGCGGGGGDDDGGSPSPTQPAETNPLTGLPGRPSGPVLGVKVDDTNPSRPQAGLNDADLVYVEPSEGGLTRLIAIYASHRPDAVGPVRSVRTSDPDILAPYGPMALAFSGGATGVLDTFRASPLVDASFDAHPDSYRREPTRSVPYNLLVNTGTLSGRVARAAGVRDVGLRFADEDSRVDSARRVSRVSVTMGNTRMSFNWDDRAGVWVRQDNGRAMVGADGKPVVTRNVLVQFCEVTPDLTDIDQAGNPAPFVHAVGEGRAVLFRDGRMIDGRWKRDKAQDPTRYTEGDTDLRLHPGGAWVLLAPADSPFDTA
ncbi:MAG TPA: DUF3048 domain-containing protein [Mycobacteriales bacterium]